MPDSGRRASHLERSVVSARCLRPRQNSSRLGGLPFSCQNFPATFPCRRLVGPQPQRVIATVAARWRAGPASTSGIKRKHGHQDQFFGARPGRLGDARRLLGPPSEGLCSRARSKRHRGRGRAARCQPRRVAPASKDSPRRKLRAGGWGRRTIAARLTWTSPCTTWRARPSAGPSPPGPELPASVIPPEPVIQGLSLDHGPARPRRPDYETTGGSSAGGGGGAAAGSCSGRSSRTAVLRCCFSSFRFFLARSR